MGLCARNEQASLLARITAAESKMADRMGGLHLAPCRAALSMGSQRRGGEEDQCRLQLQGVENR